MAIPSSCSSSFHIHLQSKGFPPSLYLLSSFGRSSLCFPEKSKWSTTRIPNKSSRTTSCKSYYMGITIPSTLQLSPPLDPQNTQPFSHIDIPETSSIILEKLLLLDLDPATAKLVIPFVGPFLSLFAFLFIVRIVMSWYPKLPVDKFPYVVAYAPTEPILIPTRKVIPPLGGVDVTPVVWFGLVSFLNEILVGPQGLLVLLSQQQV